ncbi:MAG TPA: UbiD family decarboxylase [Bacteroidia bacterium]|nr:UbiD family decarboxylase [Bacteroidia bacterium]
MKYNSLAECVSDLEQHGHLVRVTEAVDPRLEMAAIHLRVFDQDGPALLFENIKGCRYRAVSNLFGKAERSRFLFRSGFQTMQELIQLRQQPFEAFKKPWRYASLGLHALKALPRKSALPAGLFQEIHISDLPQIQHWPLDGGAFITLPQVYTEDPDQAGVMHANLGMYRVQLNGNDYVKDKEIGLHYQIHRGIGVHQSKYKARKQAMKVSVFVGGPPAHSLAAVMPLPEGMSELSFAGALGGKRFRYAYQDGYCISLDADFVITGEVYPDETKPEGPFGDHLGYYSLKHPFPLMRVHKVYARPNGIWPFTVVGRPPQEDTAFGALIHELSGKAIPAEIPGLKEIHAVDEAGVHPLLLARGSERYTPYLNQQAPAEILTQANRILGTGQLSLAKFLFISADEPSHPGCHNTRPFLQHHFERCNLERDLHFYTKTSIDTLDYSGESLNAGSKLVLAAGTEQIRTLSTVLPAVFSQVKAFAEPVLVMPGLVAVRYKGFSDYSTESAELRSLCQKLETHLAELSGIVQVVLHDQENFASSANVFRDYIWITYTRSNPSHDIYGVGEYTQHKHWACKGPLLIDARKKPHHAPELMKDPQVEKNIDRFFKAGASLEKWG